MNRACDQCNLRRTKCSRELPICHDCKKTSLTCSWNRKHSSSTNPNYQNVDTFSLTCTPLQPRFSKKDVKTKRKEDSCTFKHYSFLARSLVVEQTIKGEVSTNNKLKKNDNKPDSQKQYQVTRYPSLLVPVKSSVWSVALQNWLSNSDSRQDFYIMAKYSGVLLEEASRQDHKFLSFLLLNRRGPEVVPKKMVLQVDVKNSTSTGLLETAVDAYFHYFNSFFPLFTRQSFDLLPRSNLLRLIVWRSGLQFMTASPLQNSLIEWLDDEINQVLTLFNITPCLDTIQCFLAIGAGIGLSSSSKFHNKWPFFSIALGLTHQLGLHKRMSSSITSSFSTESLLERRLAYQAAVAWDAQRTFSIGIPFFVLGFYEDNRNGDISNLVSNYSNILLTSNQQSKDNIQEDIKQFNYSPRVILNAAMDISVLISSETIFRGSRLLLDFRHIRFQVSRDKFVYDRFLKGLFKAVQNLASIFKTSFNYLHKLRKNLTTQLDNNLPNEICESYNNAILSFDQTLCYLLIVYHSFIIHLCELGSNVKIIDFNPSLKKSSGIRSCDACIGLGLSSSVHLINLMERVGYGPFLFLRLNYITSAVHFILKNYHFILNSSNYTGHQNFPSQSKLTQALSLSYRMVVNLKSSTFFGFHTTYLLTLFDTLLTKYKVVIPK